MKSYDGKAALKGCSFVFDSAGVYALMGPNGSGKSTFLGSARSSKSPTTAMSLIFPGKASCPRQGLRRRITMVLPRVGVFNTSVFGNAAYGLHMRGYPGRETERRVHRALEAVGLVPKQRQNALTLSSGETQRLGLAGALVIEPGSFSSMSPRPPSTRKTGRSWRRSFCDSRARAERRSSLPRTTGNRPNACRQGDPHARRRHCRRKAEN